MRPYGKFLPRLTMNFLKDLFGKLFGGGGQNSGPELYVYIRPKMCREIVRVRINLYNDLSQTDDESGYIVRKEARGNRCPFPAEFTLHFDRNRNVTEREIENGEFATEENYLDFLESQKKKEDVNL
jgi:hypothetical protein